MWSNLERSKHLTIRVAIALLLVVQAYRTHRYHGRYSGMLGENEMEKPFLLSNNHVIANSNDCSDW